MNGTIIAAAIKTRLRKMNFHGLFVDEFTFGNLRIDAIVIDTKHRWIRGFEIKTSRSDFLQDYKWTQYSHFLSSLSIVCPEGLIEVNEISSPFGLLWVTDQGLKWKKRPRNFQERRSLAWLWTYVKVLEVEVPRMNHTISNLFWENENLRKQLSKEIADE